MGLAYLYVPFSECRKLVVEYMIRGLENKALQCHLPTADTCTVAKAVRAIEDYLAIRESACPTCKAVVDDGELSQLTKSAEALITQTETISLQSEMLSMQSGVLTAQSEALGWAMAKLEALERAYMQPPPSANLYSKAIQTVPTVVPRALARPPMSFFMCGGPHMKR